MPELKERAKTIVELAQSAEFLFSDGPRELDAQADKILTPEARARSEPSLSRAGAEAPTGAHRALEEMPRAASPRRKG